MEHNPQAIAEKIYGNRLGLGNASPGDGWKYRGRGYFQIAGLANYQRAAKDVNLDLVSDPDAINESKTAARQAVIEYLRLATDADK